MRILREVLLGVLLDDLLVFRDDFLQRLGVEVGVELGFLLLLLAVEHVFERRLGDVEHHAAEHLDQAAIGVVGEARIVGALGQALDRLVVQAEVEDGVHHARHGELCARAHADQQRIVGAAQLLSLELFEAAKRFVHLVVDFFRDGVVRHVLAAGFGLDGEARRNREPGIGHLGEPGAFAAELVFHLAVTFSMAVAEKVDIFYGRRIRGRVLHFSCSAHRSPLLGACMIALKTLLAKQFAFQIVITSVSCHYERSEESAFLPLQTNSRSLASLVMTIFKGLTLSANLTCLR